jgi:predicted phosphate transport protein (TIGR00153 family)
LHLLPRELCFFDYFEAHAAKTVEGCQLFLDLARGVKDVPALCAKIKEVESACDQVTHDTVASLHRVFITPIDRNDIHRLITKMDDVMDMVEGAARIIDIYEIREPSVELTNMATTLLASAKLVCEAVKGLRDLKHSQSILDRCVEINRLENESDCQLADAIAHLLRETTDPIAVIKWKEIFETVEMATDSCEDVANVIEGVVMENA